MIPVAIIFLAGCAVGLATWPLGDLVLRVWDRRDAAKREQRIEEIRKRLERKP